MDEVNLSELATPTLMRSARGAYAQAIRGQLHAIGIEDLPRSGAFVLARIDPFGGPMPDVPAELGVTKQAVSQLIDTLVTRGFVKRSPDPDDRRRLMLELTARGEEALDAVVRGVEAVDRQLEERLPGEQVEAMRAGLIALAKIKLDAITTGASRKRHARQLRRFSPIFAVQELRPALAHYETLGFEVLAYEDGEVYGFAKWEGVELHLAAVADHATRPPGFAYLYVQDADALYEQWSREGIAGETLRVGATPYGMREGRHIDPDGNVIRFGSQVGE